MASIPGFEFPITGASGTQGLLSPKGSWRSYIFPQGAFASQDSTGTLITFDSAAVASRFAAGNWIQAGLLTTNIRQVAAVGGNSLSVTGSNLTVAQNDRIFCVGNTEPTVTGGSATYTVPSSFIYQRDDDTATRYTNSMITSTSDGLIRFFAAPGLYDAIVQDSNGANQGYIADLIIGVSNNYPATFGSTVTANANFGVTGIATFGTTNYFAHIYTSQSPFVNVKHFAYGAYGNSDSATNDATAIQAAINAAAATVAGSAGTVVYLPKGTYHIDTQLIVKNRVRLVGAGRRNTIIRAGDNWSGTGSASALIRIGGSTETNVFNSTIEQLQIDVANKAGAMGVYSTACNEGSGLNEVLITNYATAGVSFNDANNRNFAIKGIECYHNGTTAHGIMLTCGEVFTVEDATINSNSGVTSSNPALVVTSGSADLRRIHVQDHSTGVYFNGTATGQVDAIIGNATVDSLVRINNSGVNVFNVYPNSSRTSVYNEVLGTSSQNSAGVQYHMFSQFGTVKTLITSDNANANYQNAKWVFGTSTEHQGLAGFSAAIVSKRENLTGSTSINVANMNWVLLGGGGTFNIMELVGGVTGQRVEFSLQPGAAGAYTFIDGQTLHTAGNFAIGDMDSISMRCLNGVSWYEVCRSNN